MADELTIDSLLTAVNEARYHAPITRGLVCGRETFRALMAFAKQAQHERDLADLRDGHRYRPYPFSNNGPVCLQDTLFGIPVRIEDPPVPLPGEVVLHWTPKIVAR